LDAYIYFTSTPFTLTMPTFRHGPIRFSKTERTDAKPHRRASQIAILGGGGDVSSSGVDFTDSTNIDDEAGEVDDLVMWLDSLGLGQLVSEEDWEQASPVVASSDGCLIQVPSVGSTREVLESPVLQEHPSGFWNEGPINPERFSMGQGVGIKRWRAQRRPKRYVRRSRKSLNSLPQSPMLDLVINHGPESVECAAPMGCNLSHDLYDFLRWEAEFLPPYLFYDN